jgi:hypothetical protein
LPRTEIKRRYGFDARSALSGAAGMPGAVTSRSDAAANATFSTGPAPMLE